MPIVETLATIVAPAIAKTVLKVWFKDSALAMDVSSSLIDLVAAKSKDELSQRRARLQFEELGRRVAKRLEPLFGNEDLPENSQKAVAQAVVETLDNTPLDAKLVVAQNLNPSALADYLVGKGRRLTRDFSAAESSLYERAIQEISTDVVDIASKLPSFSERAFAELLRRDSSLLETTGQIFAEVRSLHEEVQQAKRDEERREQAIESIHARALELRLSLSDDDKQTRHLCVWVVNRGTHIIRDVEINAIPDDKEWMEHTHGPLPSVRPGAPGVEVTYPILGGWFLAKVNQLSPNRGLAIVESQLKEGDYTKIDFDVFWNDHEGKQRKGHAVVDAAVEGDISLEPRKNWHPLLP